MTKTMPGPQKDAQSILVGSVNEARPDPPWDQDGHEAGFVEGSRPGVVGGDLVFT